MKYSVGDVVSVVNTWQEDEISPNMWIVTHSFNTVVGIRYTIEHIGSNHRISGVCEKRLVGNENVSN